MLSEKRSKARKLLALVTNNVTLADPTFKRSGKIGTLSGAEYFHPLFTIGQIKLSNYLPVLQSGVTY